MRRRKGEEMRGTKQTESEMYGEAGERKMKKERQQVRNEKRRSNEKSKYRKGRGKRRGAHQRGRPTGEKRVETG